jgi:hypothetical protein
MSKKAIPVVFVILVGAVVGLCLGYRWCEYVVAQELTTQESTTERQVLETLWTWEQFAKRSGRNTGLIAEEIATRVGTYDAYEAIADLEEQGRVHRWRDGRYHLWKEER